MKVMTTDEAAAYLKISPRKLWGLTKQGKIRSFKSGRNVRYTQEVLDEYLLSTERSVQQWRA